jgi:AGCS family alanine or glycine:cation symporter
MSFTPKATKGKSAKKSDPMWTLAPTVLPATTKLLPKSTVFTVLSAGVNEQAGNKLHRLFGVVTKDKNGIRVVWKTIASKTKPTLSFNVPRFKAGGIYTDYKGATLTAKAFDAVTNGLGMWLVTIASWLFAFSTMISWSYYGEQGMMYLAGKSSILPYKLVYCVLIVVATIPQLVSTTDQLDALTSLGTGVMLFANIPIMLIFGHKAIKAYHDYMGRLSRGEIKPTR